MDTEAGSAAPMFYPYSPPRRDDTWRSRRAAATSFPGPESSAMRQSVSPVSQVSELVRVYPGMSEDTVVIVALRHDGRPFLRVELPHDLAPAWVARLERYTVKHDTTRPAPLRLVAD